jgi:TolA-binding protein
MILRTRTGLSAAALSVALAAMLAVPLTNAAEQKPKASGTIKDLESRKIEIKRDPPTDVQAQQAIEQYKKFLELQSGNEKMRAEAMRRLGDLQVEVDEGARAATDNLTSAEVKEAVKLYEGLLAAYPNYERNDAVMYQLSRAYEAQVQPEKALAVLDQLVRKYPNSKWATEAQFRRGEILFSATRYHEAEGAYAAVVAAGKDGSFYEQGLYKHGWSLFKQGRGEDSVVSFLKVIDRVLVDNGKLRERNSLARPDRELTDDAFRAIAITYYDIDGPESLNAALKQRGDPVYAHLLYESLGNLYIEKERYQDAALAYEAFAKRRPDDRYAPSLQVRTIEAYQKGGFASLVLDGKQAFVERYAFGSAFWAQRTVEDAPEVAAQLKANQKDLAEYYHGQAQKSKKPEDYTAASRWYRAMLDSFPKDAEAPATRYLLAEVLFESGRFAEAAKEYERTAYDYPPHAKSAEAGYAALIAYQKHEPTITGESRALWHRQGIESALMFATSFPNHAESARVMTKADEELFALNDFDRVIEVSQQILERKPSVEAKYQRTASTLLAHSLFDRGRFGEAETAYVRVQSYLPANDPDRAAIEERIAASVYKQGEAKQGAGDAAGAVNDFLRVSALAPNAKVSANAEFDAAGLLIKDKQWDRAAQVLEGFRRKYPNHALTPEVSRSLAVAYLETGRAGESAGEFERIAARTEELMDVRREALWQAATLYEKSGQQANAGRAYANYVKQFSAPLDPAQNARQKLADMAKAQNDGRTRAQWISEIIAADKASGSQRTERSKYLAARGTLETVEPEVNAFNSIKLVVPLDKSLKAKRAAMEKVLASYGQALDYGVAEVTTAATYGMAELYRHLGADLIASERPKNLDAEAREQYDVLLEEQAFPFEEKAIQLHETNAGRTGSGVYDEWVQRSFDVLAKLKPARYAKAEISEDYVRTIR